jgi:membrane associated rhomboid family serine protease
VDDPRPGGGGQPDADPPSGERTSGLTLETCYRHEHVLTGVHCTRCGRPICPDCMHEAPVGYQCPTCVAEARRTAPRRRARLVVGGPTSVAATLMAVNIVMFGVELVTGAAGGLVGGGSGRRLFDLGAMQPIAIAVGDQYWRLFSAMFLHAGLIHLLFNMYALYLFGFVIERAVGSVRFLAIYFVSGFLASVASFAFGSPGTLGVGASGAIFGLLGAWVAYNLRRRGTAMASANLQWAAMIIGINLIFGFSVAGIDNLAHLGGLVSGVAAGWVAEGIGSRKVRPFVQGAGFVALIAVGVGLTFWRVATFPPVVI